MRIFYILFFVFLLSFLYGCHKPPTKLKKLLSKYPELLKRDTIVRYDTIKVESVKIETVILKKTDTVEVLQLVSPIKDSLERTIVIKNIYQYLEKLRKIDTIITVKDVSLWVHTDSLGELRVGVIREARNEIRGTKTIHNGYIVEPKKPPNWVEIIKYAIKTLFFICLGLVIIYFYGKR